MKLDSVYLAQELERRFPGIERDRIEDIAETVERILPNCLMKHAPDNLLPNSRLQSMKKLLALEQQPAPRTLLDAIRAMFRPARKKEV